MSMEISNNYSNYAKSGTSTAKEGNVTTSTVELKPYLYRQLYGREKDFVPFQTGFRSLAADCVKILPI